MKQKISSRIIAIGSGVLAIILIVFAAFAASTYVAPVRPVITQGSVAKQLAEKQSTLSSSGTVAIKSATKKAATSSPSSTNLVNTGPGNSTKLFIGTALASTALFYGYQLKRLKKAQS